MITSFVVKRHLHTPNWVFIISLAAFAVFSGFLTASLRVGNSNPALCLFLLFFGIALVVAFFIAFLTTVERAQAIANNDDGDEDDEE